MTKTFRLPTLKCLRCGHVWIPRRPREPKKCPGCASPYWNKPKWKGLRALDDGQIEQHSTTQARGYKAEDTQKEASIDDKVTYKYLKSHSGNWQNAAEKLLRVAYKLELERDSKRKEFIATPNEDVYYMLIGLALENYLKGAIVRKLVIGQESLDEDKLDRVLVTHDLAALFSEAGLKIPSKLHESYLHHLTECVEWRGRYRLPTKAKRIGGSIKYFPPDSSKPGRLRIGLTEMTHTIPIHIIHEFVDKAKAHLDHLKKQPQAKKL